MKTRLRRIALYNLFFFYTLAMTFVIPIFSRVIFDPTWGDILPAHSMELRPLFLGLLISIYPLAALVTSYLLAHTKKAFSLRKTFTIAILAMIGGLLLSGLAIRWGSYLLLTGSRLFTGFFSATSLLALAFVVDGSTNQREIQKEVNRVGIIVSFTFIVGMIFGGSLDNPAWNPLFHASLPFYILSACFVLPLLTVFLLPKDSVVSHSSINEICRCYHLPHLFRLHTSHKLYTIHLFAFFILFSWIAALQFINAYMVVNFDITRVTTLVVLSLMGLLWLISSLFLSRWIHKLLPEDYIFYILITLGALLLFSSAVATSIWILAFSIFLFTLVMGTLWTRALTLLSAHLQQHEYLENLSYKQAIIQFASTLAPILASPLGILSLRWIYLFSALSLLIAVPFGAHTMRRFPWKNT